MTRSQARFSTISVLGIMSNSIGWKNPGLFGGAEVRGVEVLKRWHRHGVLIETIEGPPFPSIVYHNKYSVYMINLPSGKNFGHIISCCVLWLVKVFTKLIHLKLSGRKYNVVVALNSLLSDVLLSFIASKLFKCPFAVIVQNTGIKRRLGSLYSSTRIRNRSIINSIFWAISTIITLRLIRSSSAIICLSTTSAQELLRAGIPNHKIYISGMGLELEEIQQISPSEEEYDCAYMGRIETTKGIFDLLRAWLIVVKERPNAKLVIIGSGSDLEAAKLFTIRHNIVKNVDFKGFIGTALRFSYLKSSKVFVAPIIGQEGWGLVIAEAIACGTSVICYDNPVFKEIFSDLVTFVPRGNIYLLANTILHSLEKNHQKKNINFLDRIKQFDWDYIAMRDLEVVSSLLLL
jgi:glycosyltransferase involved in cell wall biosynthesis